MTPCPTCLLAVERCAACGEPLDAAWVGVWHMTVRNKQGTWGTRQHRHYHPGCAPPQAAGQQPPARAPAPPRAQPGGSAGSAGPTTDACDVCHKRLPVAELAYRTLPPRRSGGREILLVGHRACLDRRAGDGAAEAR